MKRHFLLLFVVQLLVVGLYGQQDEQYTQFMYNKLAYNPGYAGSANGICLNAIVRSQWIGLDGAPQTQSLGFHMPLANRRVGIGANIIRNTIGASEDVSLDGMYAYRAALGSGIIGIGIQGSITFLSADLTGLPTTQPSAIDEAIPMGNQSKFIPNFGVGAYFNNERFYFGFSVPRLLQNNIDLADSEGIISREVQHFYLMTGFLIPMGAKVDFQPQLLVKYVDNAPLDADLNASFIFNDRFITGLTYRLGGNKENPVGESIDLLLGAQITDDILFAASYDITLSDIRDYNSGSIEALLRYCFGGGDSNSEYTNPRFF